MSKLVDNVSLMEKTEFLSFFFWMPYFRELPPLGSVGPSVLETGTGSADVHVLRRHRSQREPNEQSSSCAQLCARGSRHQDGDVRPGGLATTNPNVNVNGNLNLDSPRQSPEVTIPFFVSFQIYQQVFRPHPHWKQHATRDAKKWVLSYLCTWHRVAYSPVARTGFARPNLLHFSRCVQCG